jgi:Uma2 family endonuclease
MVTSIRPWTRDELQRLPDDGNRYEVLDGTLLVTPLPSVRHQDLAGELGALLRRHCERHGIGLVVGPAAVPFGESELQPDLAIFPGRRPDDARWDALPIPLLVVEILSSSTRQRDLGAKRAAYLRWGIAECWLVDPRSRTVTVARRGAEDDVVSTLLRWSAPPANVPLEIALDLMPW